MPEITCPECGKVFIVNIVGRKSYNVDFTNVCKALQDTLRRDGKPNYTMAAKKVSEGLGRDVTPGFVHNRITRAARERGMDRKELLAGIINGVGGIRK